MSVMVWLLERNVNDQISSTLYRGIADAFWLNNVTLVTVGYVYNSITPLIKFE